MPTLYVTDLDGTLLDPSSKVSRESLEILNEVIDAGGMVTVATARTPATVQPLLAGLHRSVTPLGRSVPAIVMTGAGYWDLHLQQFVYLRMMSGRDKTTIRRIFRENLINPFIYCIGPGGSLNVYHTSAMTSREDAFYQERRHLPLKRFHLGQEPARGMLTVLFFAISSPDKAEKTCREINRQTDCSAAWYRDIFNPEVALMDVYAPGCSKASAVKDVTRELGADRIVVFGDNLNDLPMMEVADLSVAVGNALPQVRERASLTIGSNASPSVARFIRDDFFRNSEKRK